MFSSDFVIQDEATQPTTVEIPKALYDRVLRNARKLQVTPEGLIEAALIRELDGGSLGLAESIATLLSKEMCKPLKAVFSAREAARYVRKPVAPSGSMTTFRTWCVRFKVKSAHDRFPVSELDRALSEETREILRGGAR